MTNSLNRDREKELLKKIQELSIEIDEGMKDYSDAEYRANYRSELIVTLFNRLKQPL